MKRRRVGENPHAVELKLTAWKNDKAKIEDYSQTKGCLKHTPCRRGLIKQRVSKVVFVCCLILEQKKNPLTATSFDEKKTFVSHFRKTD